MKITYTIDIDDYLDGWCHDINDTIKESLKDEVMRIVRKDPKYKAYINKQAMKVLDNLEI